MFKEWDSKYMPAFDVSGRYGVYAFYWMLWLKSCWSDNWLHYSMGICCWPRSSDWPDNIGLICCYIMNWFEEAFYWLWSCYCCWSCCCCRVLLLLFLLVLLLLMLFLFFLQLLLLWLSLLLQLLRLLLLLIL